MKALKKIDRTINKMRVLFIMCCIASIYCSGKKENSIQVIDTKLQNDSLPRKNLIIKDEKKYSKTFINSLHLFMESDVNISDAKLIDSVIIFAKNPKREGTFPTYPILNRSYLLTAKSGLTSYELVLRRINYSDLEFHILLKDDSGIIYESRGIAIISPGFINGAEIYEDELTNGGYPAYGYDTDDDTCFTSLVVSSSVEDNQLKAKIREISCGNKKAQELIENMPTLRVSDL